MLAATRVLATLLLVLYTAGCALLRPAEIPIASEYFHYDDANSTLVVLLHGRGDEPGYFVRHGTVEQIRACRPEANIIGVDSHFGYYRERIIEQRLREDIIGPARANGAEQVWIAGISLGGLGGLVYRQKNPADIDGVILMAPYLGDWDELEVYLDGSAAARARLDPDFVDIWQAIETIPPERPALALAFGEDDGFNRQHRWLAGLLGDERVVSGPGGHDWQTWQALWPDLLQRSGLCESA